MFSLIITIISIALVAALALATLYYGGSAYEQSQSRAKAAQVSNQAQQLLGAAELFYAQNGRWNNSMEELVSEKFLKSIPLAQASSVSQALASDTPWTMPMAGQPVFFLASMDVGPCRDVNERAYGMPGILPQLHAGYILQCFGTSSTSLTTVAGRSAQHLAAVASGGIGLTSAQLASADVPARGDTPAWFMAPDAAGESARTIVQNAGYRAWSDGSTAVSCNAYRTANGNDSYTGATGDGVYRIGLGGTPTEVYCDMTTDGGGWTLAAWNKGNSGLTNMPANFMVASINRSQVSQRNLASTASSLNVEDASRAMGTNDVMLMAAAYSSTPLISRGLGTWDYDRPPVCTGPLGRTSRTAGCLTTNHAGNDDFSNWNRFNIALYGISGAADSVIGPAWTELCYPNRGWCNFEFYLR